MERDKPVLDQVNIVAGSFDRSFDFYRRLGVTFAEPVTNNTDDPFHANGETSNGLRFELDNAAFAPVWNPGWAAHSDLVGSCRIGVRSRFARGGGPGLCGAHKRRSSRARAAT